MSSAASEAQAKISLVSPSSPDPLAKDQWHLFNDFLVHPTTKEDALRFDPTWKLPSVLAYQLKSASHCIDFSWTDHLDTSLLYRRISPRLVFRTAHR
jgi:PAB-dependent poly(A)-specific ribonuclease subunit 2